MNSIISKKVGSQIRYYRKLRRYSQKDLARLIGVTQTTVSCWESGRYTPSLENIYNLCILLRVTADKLIVVYS